MFISSQIQCQKDVYERQFQQKINGTALLNFFFNILKDKSFQSFLDFSTKPAPMCGGEREGASI